MKKELKIWYNDDNSIGWKGKNLKPSEISSMGACLVEHALKMVDSGTVYAHFTFGKAGMK